MYIVCHVHGMRNNVMNLANPALCLQAELLVNRPLSMNCHGLNISNFHTPSTVALLIPNMSDDH